MNKPGTLRVAKATPEGYEEVTRLEVFDQHSWSAPAFSNGYLYTRSMSQLARIDPISASVAAEATAPWIAATGFGRFLAEVETAQDKDAVIDAYFGQQNAFPIIEETGAVHFVYQGDAKDVGIVGDMIGYRREDPMIRVADTNLFYYSTRLEPDASVSYGFITDFGDPVPDPRNPVGSESLFGPVSFVSMPAWQSPDFLAEADAARQGSLEEVEWQSTVREGETRQAEVYLPAGYPSATDRSYPTVYILDGSEALKHGNLKNGLDNLIGSSVEPIIAVLVTLDPENPDGDVRDPAVFAEMVATELVPLIDKKYRTRTGPMQRAVAGAADAGDAAIAGAIDYPELFGRVGALWPIVFQFDLSTLPEPDEQPMVIYHVWGTYHMRSPHEAWDQVVENRSFFRALRDAGYRPAGGEVPEGFGWANWRGYTDDMLTALFPIR